MRPRQIIRRTMIPAAAFSWKPFCGREIQLKIWMGNVEKGENNPFRLKYGNSPEMGKSGRKATYVSAPMVIKGAVSPIALERARIIPVIIPGIAQGKT